MPQRVDACGGWRESFHWAGKYHDDMVGRDTLATDLNVLIGWEPKVCKSGNNADFVMLGNLDPAVQLAVLDQVAAPKLVVLDTMNFWMDVALDNLKKIIARVDVLTVNDEEARQLTGEHFLPKAARAIHAMGPKTWSSRRASMARSCSKTTKCFSHRPSRSRRWWTRPAQATRSLGASLATWLRVTKRQASCRGKT